VAPCAALLLPAPALAGSARIDQTAGQPPQVVFQGGSEVNDVGVSRSVPPEDEIVYTFFDTQPISLGSGCRRDGGPDTRAVCHLPGRSERQGRISLGGGNDRGNASLIFIMLQGDGGNDDLVGRAVDGGPGDDQVRGTFADDVFFVAPGDGTDTLDGSAGTDHLRLPAPGTLDMRGNGDDITSVEALDGTTGDDVIIADDRVDPATGDGWIIFGQDGNDRLVAGDAGGHLLGGNGNDTLTGGIGDDSLDGGDDNDTLDGGVGADHLNGSDGDDTLRSDDGIADDDRCGDGTDRARPDTFDTVAADCELRGDDRDGDGLQDDWEEHGYDADGDGTVDLDLPAMGADPDHKDVFAEIDFMAPHRIQQPAVDLVTQAFAEAPVADPDGSAGITLHVDNGPTSVMDPRTGSKWGTRSRQDQLPHQAVLGSFTTNGDVRTYQWGEFDVLKFAHFDQDREPVFHYVISAHAHDGTASGISRDIPASDLLITLGAGCQQAQGADCTLDAKAQAGTLMHELGHNLGLRHGGADDTRYKPNYLSVMNYTFQLTGVVGVDLSAKVDYSRFRLSLDETALDEAHGFGQTSGSEPAALLTVGFCPNGSQVVWPLVDGALDFNCDGVTTQPGTVASDTNHDGDKTALDGFLDWPALVYAGGAIGAAGRSVPSESELIEPSMAELLADQRTIEAFVAAQRGGSGPPGPGPGPAAPGSARPPGVAAAPGPVRLAALRVTPSRFRSARRGRPIVRRGGAKVSYRLNRAATVVFSVQRRKGRRFTTVRGSFKQAARAGANALRFSGRLAGKRLPRGRYRLVAKPRGGAAARARFAVRR
jgi:hypothetical protein